jgi:hypothetical protein
VIYLTNNGFIIFFDYFFAFWVSALGAVFAVVSLFRRERHLPLSLAALILNAAPFIWLWSIQNHRLTDVGP